jgi:septum formation protein
MLLEEAGMEFEIMVSDASEEISGKSPEETVKELSRRKALSIDPLAEGECIILAADTVVACDDMILGKPADEADAFRMLSRLQGRTHQVYTGVTILQGLPGQRKSQTFAVCTDVTMYEASVREIEAYIKSGEPADKAGAYAIQGKGFYFVKEIHGDYNNVVGLPTLAVRMAADLCGLYQ